MMILIDGGYLSWFYGVRDHGRFAWMKKRIQYQNPGVKVVFDSDRNWRTEVYPDYKLHRRMRIEDNFEDRLKKARVESFKKEIFHTPYLNCIGVEGLEADDVVSWLVMANWDGLNPTRVVGIDKDYAQLGQRIKLEPLGGQVRSDPMLKYPKTIHGCIHGPEDFVMVLALLGDKSDDIPRLIPPMKLKEFQQIMSHKTMQYRMQHALDSYGYDFLRNLYLVVLPGPACYKSTPSFNEVFDLVSQGKWGEQSLDSRDELTNLRRLFAKEEINDAEFPFIFD